MKRTLLAMLLFTSGHAGSTWGVEPFVHRARTRPECLTGIPDRNYPFPRQVGFITATSRRALLLPAAPLEWTVGVDGQVETATPLPIHLFVLSEPQLEIDHCSISQVAVQIQPNGDWTLSLRGDQNRRPPAGQANTYNPRLHIRRNEFSVQLRCLGNFREEPSEVGNLVPKPVLVDLGPVHFWVENGEPRHLRHRGNSRELAAALPLIDRVEVEFSYRP